MKNLIVFITILLLAVNTASLAQQSTLVTSGTIEYTKTINMYTLLKQQGADANELAFDQYKQQHPQFTRLYSKLSFSGQETFFEPLAAGNLSAGFFNVPRMAPQNNRVYMNHQTGTFISQKSVFDATYLLKDSIRKIRWKLTAEVRDIAGYSCRRANGLLMDSIYVVAFYTDQIPVAGGPESFIGLPGMILQVAMPHEHISWIATKITVGPIEGNAVRPPKKGKPMDLKTLTLKLRELSEQRHETTDGNLKAFLF